MDTFLTQLLGLYFIIVGVVVLVRQRSLMPAIQQLAANRGLVLLLGIIELAAGLSLVLAYPTVEFSVAGVIGLIGYVLTVEGIIYIAAPVRYVQNMVRSFTKPKWFTAGGLLSIALGCYLAGTSFGLI
jgi:hypothetical protein